MCTRAFSMCVEMVGDDDMPPHFLGAPSSTAAAEQSYSIHANHLVQFIHKAICFPSIFFDSTHSCCCFLNLFFLAHLLWLCTSYGDLFFFFSAGHLMWIATKCHFDLRHASIIIWWLYTRSGFGFFTYRKASGSYKIFFFFVWNWKK